MAKRIKKTTIVEKENIGNDSNAGIAAVSTRRTLSFEDDSSTQSQLSKLTIHQFLEKTLHLKLSKYFLADVIISDDGKDNELNIVGRPKIEGTTKQHRHVIPFSFVTKLIESTVQKASSPKELLTLLIDKVKIFILAQKGFALKQSDLETDAYSDISARMTESSAADRSLTISTTEGPETILLASPSKTDKVFTTPTKQKKATEEYAGYNLLYVTEALTKLSKAILDSNTAIIASQALSRFLFILFNKNSDTCFADSGHSQNFEIRLYDSEDEAANPTKSSYKVLTPIELAHHLAELSPSDYRTTTAKELIEGQHWRLDKCLRIANCEGNRIKAIPDALKILDNIICHFNLHTKYSSTLIDEYNQTDLELKLLNYIGEPLIYNSDLVNNETIQDNIAAQVAKLLYIAFNLKAPENLSFYPVMDTGIVTYTSANGKKSVNYTFKNGKTVREFEKSQSSADDKFLRDDDHDKEILAQKLVEMLYIGTAPFAGFTTGFHPFDTNFLLSALEHMIKIAAIDYDMQDKETFHDEVISIFDELLLTPTSLDHSDLILEASVIGNGSLLIDKILDT